MCAPRVAPFCARSARSAAQHTACSNGRMFDTLDVLTSTLSSTLRFWRGTNARAAAEQPARPLQLYEFEACPYCRLVREALTELDLDALIYPTPHGGKRFRPKVAK